MLITHASEISNKDIFIDYKNKIIFINSEITIRALYSYCMGIFDEPAQMDDFSPISVIYICKCCGYSDWSLINSWVIEGKSYIKNELADR